VSGRAPWLWTGGALLLSLILSSAVGPVGIPPASILRLLLQDLGLAATPAEISATFRTILFETRLPHSALMALAGMAPGASGAAYQGLCRDPLADPYILGVAAGAGLGAITAMTIQWPTTALGMATVPAAAFLGAMATVGVITSVIGAPFFLWLLRRAKNEAFW
jgi:iron complex transport system permease protein